MYNWYTCDLWLIVPFHILVHVHVHVREYLDNMHVRMQTACTQSNNTLVLWFHNTVWCKHTLDLTQYCVFVLQISVQLSHRGHPGRHPAWFLGGAHETPEEGFGLDALEGNRDTQRWHTGWELLYTCTYTVMELYVLYTSIRHTSDAPVHSVETYSVSPLHHEMLLVHSFVQLMTWDWGKPCPSSH